MYWFSDTALGELNHPNPLEPQKFKKRSRHRNVKQEKEKQKIKKKERRTQKTTYSQPTESMDPRLREDDSHFIFLSSVSFVIFYFLRRHSREGGDPGYFYTINT